jgi:L-threonylcarbamoyladenylate synthase
MIGGADGAGSAALSDEQADRFQWLLESDGVCVFPTDTVYGIGCSPDSQAAIDRVYELKGRPAAKPSAVMFFTRADALAALAELAPRERAAVRALLPGALTLLLPNRARRFLAACGPDPDTLGLRVPTLTPALAALARVHGPVLQSSANLSGEPEARRVEEVPAALRRGAQLVLDGGELPGVASTVVDLREFQPSGSWRVLREGAVDAGELARLLGLLA